MTTAQSYHIGDIIEGQITGIQPYGVFVKLDKYQQGLIHISELNHGYVSDIHQHYQVGDAIKVQIIDIDEYTQKLSLSARSLKPLKTPKRPKKLGRPPKRKLPDIGFQSLDKQMPGWIDQALDNIQNYDIKETNHDSY
ncbi:CvfD/Ygs/GSP13 family RNA-binding post-transcriptional regulator [Aerococcus kribbianus]|uniref:CvfD/Ygs/GSP13 family RNA-binding post-transcriptional regulator n=1 Tax=Aerococcus kribbianus TaxID=2999064 RepID=A0A9X3FPK7_9LACT|nr:MULTISPECIES: CvfD/Ygs/GSP13 family RNA-binding post-transcriptional regulator [unclassified Aerococcus]MCZ0717638.1 CvfD/Ygs/GSP13 family RNA-binding post-transcriptional regulator [Aerococcus sp. YH-aer221]MCZ0725926.1 CvfD/Ygs/GSP13 family RNA-binding post-transcriptional regulator [Aerococcus sp. YH-aer222]